MSRQKLECLSIGCCSRPTQSMHAGASAKRPTNQRLTFCSQISSAAVYSKFDAVFVVMCPETWSGRQASLIGSLLGNFILDPLSWRKAQVPICFKIDVSLSSRVFNHKFTVSDLLVGSKFPEIDSKNRNESLCRADKFMMKGAWSPKTINKKDRLWVDILGCCPRMLSSYLGIERTNIKFATEKVDLL